MERLSEQRSILGQGKGPDVELVVSGTPYYATYETIDGFPVVYDDRQELFCYARLGKDGAFESTGVSLDFPPPSDIVQHAQESESVRARKTEARIRQLERRSPDRPDELED